MKNILKHLLLGSLLSFCGPAAAQLRELQHFSDSLSGKLDYIFDHLEAEDGILLSGKMIEPGTERPVLMKINTNGETVWTTFATGTPWLERCYDFNIELFSDGFIYGIVSGTDGIFTYPKVMWKVNAATGALIWAKTIPYSSFRFKTDLADYDSSYIVAVHYVTDDLPTLGVYSKATGDTLFTKTYTLGALDFSVAVDANKNILLSRNGTLQKFNRMDPEQIIWEKQYPGRDTAMRSIRDIYLDAFDDIYLFGQSTEPHTTGLAGIFRIDPNTGEKLWQKLVAVDYRMVDMQDRNGYLYATYRQELVGSGPFFYLVVKINKQTGVLAWSTLHRMPTTGTPTSHSGDSESALSLDIDCNGDVYLTGYYGDANYGPEAWGNMKLNGSDGSILYAHTVTVRPGPYDNYSSGVAVCVFGNSPVILGHLEYEPELPKAAYLTLDPATGAIQQLRPIDAGGYQPVSQTLDIVNRNGEMYVLKQVGYSVVMERRTANNILIWARTLTDNGMLRGGQLQVTNNYIYLTAYHPQTVSAPPYYNNQTEKLKFYRLNRITGNLTGRDSLTFTSGVVVPLELEADENQVFAFYRRDGSMYYCRWNGSTLSAQQLLEAAGNNVNYEGKLDIVKNLNGTTLLVAGRAQLFSVNKATLAKTPVYTYGGGNRNVYDLCSLGDTLFVSGSNAGNTQVITALNQSTYTLKWEQTYLPGSVYKTLADDSNRLYSLQKTGLNMGVRRLSAHDGTVQWNRVSAPESTPFDLEINTARAQKYLTAAGARVHSATHSDVLLQVFNLQGDSLYSFSGADEFNLGSKGYTLAYAADSSIWAGGAWNRISRSKEGFVYSLGSMPPLPATVSAGLTALSLCAGTGFNVSYTVTDGTLLPGNVFTAELSDASGDFTAPTVIGTRSSTALSGTVPVFLPTGTPAGNGYRIRVRPSTPSFVSNDNGADITVSPIPVVQATASSTTACADGTPVFLTGSPAGGTWTGNGVSGSQFNPATAGTGIHRVVYSYQNPGGCRATDTLQLTVYALPAVTQSALNNICLNASPVTLTGGTPAGGTYTGTGVNAGLFTPATAGAGTHTISYTYENTNGCRATATAQLTVYALPTVTQSALPALCVYDSAIPLTGGIPVGGQYNGTGVNAGIFNPAVSGTGTFEITYTYTDGNGCSAEAVTSLNVSACLSINDAATAHLHVYPNPTSRIVYVTGLSGKALPYELKNVWGQPVLRGTLNEVGLIDLGTLAGGTYFLQIEGRVWKVVRE